MTDELLARRDALRAQLRDVERALADREGAQEPHAAWRAHAAGTPEFLLFLNERLDVLFAASRQPGVSDPAGHSLLDFLPPESHERFRAAARAGLATSLPHHLEVTGPGPHGATAFYSIWMVPTPTAATGAFVLIAADVSHLRRVEEELEGERGLLTALITHAPDFFTVVDRERRVRFVNRASYGFAPEAVLGMRVEDFTVPEDQALVREAITSIFETGEPRAFEVRMPSPDGLRWFSSRAGPVWLQGKIHQVSIVTTDVTERVALEATRARERDLLVQSEARFRTLVEHAPEATVILDLDTGRFSDANASACRLFGLDRDALLGRGPGDMSPERQPDGRASGAAAQEALQRAEAGEHLVFEWAHQSDSGELLLCEVRLVRLPHPDRRLIRASVIDIGPRKQAEAERERMAVELFQAQKMQAIGQLTGGVAHDFNNLLTVIMSSVEMIELDTDEEHVRGHARQVMEATRRAAALTQRLLAFARRQPLRPQVLNLNRLVAGTESLLRRTLGETIEIETVLGGGLWSCEADPTQLENVILNLAINARDAMPDGGRLTIETANARLDREYASDHDEVEPGQYVMLAVTDSGTGMEPGVLGQAFEPFFTTKEVGRGSGLGLSMVYGFVKQSGGHVKIYSELGVGTTVRIYLRRSMEETEQASLRPTGGEPPGDGSLVLVVEDDADVRALVVRMVERLGYRAISAPDGSTALATLEQEPGVALLLTDVVLPAGSNGAELARQARALRPRLAVLFMSGYTENAIIHNGRLDPGVVLIEKPFSRRQLAIALRHAFDAR